MQITASVNQRYHWQCVIHFAVNKNQKWRSGTWGRGAVSWLGVAGKSQTAALFKFPDGVLKFVRRGKVGSAARRSTDSRQLMHIQLQPAPAALYCSTSSQGWQMEWTIQTGRDGCRERCEVSAATAMPWNPGPEVACRWDRKTADFCYARFE